VRDAASGSPHSPPSLPPRGPGEYYVRLTALLIFTVSVAVIGTDNSLIHPFMYVVPLEEHYEVTVVLNIHAVNYDTVTSCISTASVV
jgi:hypothetical protein